VEVESINRNPLHQERTDMRRFRYSYSLNAFASGTLSPNVPIIIYTIDFC
jgi:hypothetical protein